MLTSLSNPRIKALALLRKSARERMKQACFLVEGPRMFFEIPSSRLRQVFLTEAFEESFRDRLSGIDYELVSDAVMKHIADTRSPQGVLAVVSKKESSLEEMMETDSPCLLLLESLQDPGNLGTIFRSAEAAGFSGLIMNRTTVDPYNPKVIRSTMGAVFRIPFLVAEDFTGLIRRIREEGVCVYGADMSGASFYDCDYQGPCAFLIGNEGRGLSREARELADGLISIPMEGQVESLNAAVSASLIMYELVRQRKQNDHRHII